jgi:hypothetical protein
MVASVVAMTLRAVGSPLQIETVATRLDAEKKLERERGTDAEPPARRR